MQRLKRAPIGVGDIRVADREAVDQQRIRRGERVLPTLVFDLRRTLRLRREIRQVQIELRIVKLKVADEPAKDQRLPVHAGVHVGDVGDRRVGMSLLVQIHLFEIQRQAYRMEVEEMYLYQQAHPD